jgi:acetyl-CoA carboxylase biotin carboxylase subunit
MSSELARKVVNTSPRKVLVFGERAIAELIAKDLSHEGFEPVFLKDLVQKQLPPIADPNSLREMKNILTEFSILSSGSGLVHPGNTVWAERPELVSIAQELGLVVICPPVRVLSLFGNRLNFLMEAERLGIPNLVQSFDPMHTVREVEEFIERTGQTFPFLLKAIRGGGSFGLFAVQDIEALEKSLPLWCDQLRRNFGEVILFAERCLEGARHVILPFARFQDGRTQVFPISDGSLQCRYRKVIEFSPSTCVDADIKHQLTTWTLRLAQSSGFVGVGAMEFLVDSSRVFLIDGMARLNTSFHLWEKVAGTHAVSWQLAALEGYADTVLPEIKPEAEWQSGVCVRFYAEDSLLHLPQPGLIHELSVTRKWEFPGSRAELLMSYDEGGGIPTNASGILGHLFITAIDRKQVLGLVHTILREIWIAGTLQTNEQFILELLAHPWVQEEMFHAGFVDEEFLPATRPSAEILPLFASVCASHPDLLAKKEDHVRWAVGEQWIRTEDPIPLELKWESGPNFRNEGGLFGVSGKLGFKDGTSVRVGAFPVGDRWNVRIGSWFMSVRRIHISLTRRKKQSLKVSALASGRIHAIFFRPGVFAPAHEALLIIESLGVFIPHALPYGGRIIRWKVSAEDTVYVGQELADIELVQVPR